MAQDLAVSVRARLLFIATPLPTELPIGLSDEFATDGTRQALWTTFLRKNALTAIPLGMW